MIKSTHFIFKDDNIFISPDLKKIVLFLQEIEREVESLLNFEKKLNSIRKQYLETIELVGLMAKKLKENSIDLKYTLSEHPATIADKLKIFRPVRSEMIVLFANLETLLCLNIAYENKTYDENKIRKTRNHYIKSFIKEFCLNPDNEWYKNNQKILKHITAGDLINLRNSLTHFFSVSKKIGISHALDNKKSRRLEKAINFRANFISPEDLNEMIKGAAKLMIFKWSNDCNNCIANNSNDFKERILSVKSIIEESGVEVIKSSQINI
ncbi:MAG: hypothetical protein V1690_02065 [Candidatus Moraniibacteriota bacterium]